jgi:hypothetical protein
MRVFHRGRGLLLAMTALALGPFDAMAIPAFARRYKVTCALCHNPMPTLTEFGNRFAANGYRMASGEAMPDSIGTNDPLLSLPDKLPLAVRLDLYAQAYANGKAATDFQSPYGLKLMSGGAISKKLSYYFYTFLAERGEVGGIEDAFIHVNDIGNQPLDLALGQYQVSDPLSKRELRLEFEDYAVYRARVGDVPVDLTYDRGLMAAAEVGGFTLTGDAWSLTGNRGTRGAGSGRVLRWSNSRARRRPSSWSGQPGKPRSIPDRPRWSPAEALPCRHPAPGPCRGRR